jgi:hypothetical protein
MTKNGTLTSDIYKSLFNYFSDGYEYQMQNVFIFHYDWESDFFCLNREGYSFEFEVKVSRSDFKADFKKKKHKMFTDRMAPKDSLFNNSDPKRQLLPNRFYFVCPPDMIDVNEIPSYAGLIYSEDGHCTIIKRAPFIHRVKSNYRRKLCDKFYYQWLAMKKELRIEKNLNRELVQRIENLKKEHLTQQS